MAVRWPDVLLSCDGVAQPQGGVSRYTVELHRGLLARGVRSRLLAGLHDNRYVDGVPQVTGRRVPSFRGRGSLNRVAERALLSVAPAPTIYHKTFYRPGRPPARQPVVVTVHDMIDERFPDLFPDDSTPRWKAFWCRRADVVLANSAHTKAEVVDLIGLPAERVVVTPLGVTVATPAAVSPLPAGRDYLLYVGSRARYKNFGGLVAAVARWPGRGDHDLVCVGGGPFTAAEQGRLADGGLAGHVRRLDADDAGLAALYAGARALVYPSLSEGFGLPTLEAMALGCPVACARRGALPEVVGDAAVLFDPDDPDDVVSALDRVTGDEALRAQLVEAGRRRASRYTWDRTVDATVAAYAAVGGPGSSR